MTEKLFTETDERAGMWAERAAVAERKLAAGVKRLDQIIEAWEGEGHTCGGDGDPDCIACWVADVSSVRAALGGDHE